MHTGPFKSLSAQGALALSDQGASFSSLFLSTQTVVVVVAAAEAVAAEAAAAVIIINRNL